MRQWLREWMQADASGGEVGDDHQVQSLAWFYTRRDTQILRCLTLECCRSHPLLYLPGASAEATDVDPRGIGLSLPNLWRCFEY
jgi:hypothetical protein